MSGSLVMRLTVRAEPVQIRIGVMLSCTAQQPLLGHY